LLEPTGPSIGLMASFAFAVDKVLFEKGDILVAYTDGVVDARNTSDVSFSEETLISQIKKPYPSAFSLLKNIENKLAIHVADTDQFDDITMLALRYKVEANEEKHEISQLAILDNLTNLKEFIDQAGRHMELQEDVIFAFKLAVEEAGVNIITHGYKDSDPGQIKLTFEKELKRIVLTIYDEGVSFDPKDASEADIESDWEEREIGGLGLLMMREMMDEISYESVDEKGNFLKLSKKND
jgi:sigma-B regulation protein RsbU (phosphoserine phosphatase)